MTGRQKPPRLQAGMTLGVVAPSSQIFERSVTWRGVEALEKLGFNVVFAPHAHDRYGYIAGSDRDRADDLLSMFFRDDVDAVICMRGGVGANRTANALDRELLAKLKDRPPKPFIGFSDITVPHAIFAKELNWVTFYGPMVITFPRATEYTLAAFRRALMETEPFDILPDPDDSYVETMVPGVAEGELVGGCLQLLAALVGTPWEVETRGKILFFEDVHVPPFSIDRSLSQLIAAGKLQECAGIVIGEHTDCVPKNAPSLSLEQVFDDLIRPLGIPTLYHLPIGHGKHLATLPIGVQARLDATNKTLSILEPGVT
ncbi:MAG: LD-carboxypeptidase [Chloroflexota bacterium]|nr:LD-carboxypeptidase [Chloroflexota bacterium]MDQ6907600.1 LD-carboxypeptidase [Chloroflexota bacterium]